MFLASLPFDYAKLVDRGDRVRTRRERTTGNRFRRTNPRGDA
jgi:hypothetical protein